MERVRRKLALVSENFHQATADIKAELFYVSGEELSPYSLLRDLHPFLAQVVSHEMFLNLEEEFGNADKVVVDIGAGSSPMLGTIFLDAQETYAADPAYEWYEYKSQKSFQ